MPKKCVCYGEEVAALQLTVTGTSRPTFVSH